MKITNSKLEIRPTDCQNSARLQSGTRFALFTERWVALAEIIIKKIERVICKKQIDVWFSV